MKPLKQVLPLKFFILQLWKYFEITAFTGVFFNGTCDFLFQPPRRSYKRKRVGSNYTDDSHAEDAESHEKAKSKKRKISKVEKMREKELDEWANELNRTFEEIDHFPLVVE